MNYCWIFKRISLQNLNILLNIHFVSTYLNSIIHKYLWIFSWIFIWITRAAGIYISRHFLLPVVMIFFSTFLANDSCCLCRITAWMLISFFMKPRTRYPEPRAWHGQGSLTKTWMKVGVIRMRIEGLRGSACFASRQY